MVRMLINLVLTLVANALGLIVADQVLDNVSLTVNGFFIAVGIFTLAMILMMPLFQKMALKYARALGGSSALLATLASLIITSIISEGLRIRGFTTWILATVIVWLVSLIGNLVLPAIFLRKKVNAVTATR